MITELRPTSFAMQRYKKAVEERARDGALGDPRRWGDPRDWIRASDTLDDQSIDNYPIYNDITGLPIPGTTAGIIGIMLTG